MKKAILAIGLLTLALVGRAQYTVTANLSFSSDGYASWQSGIESTDPTLPKGFSLGVHPRVGLELTPTIRLGAQLGFDYAKYTYIDGYCHPERAVWVQTRQIDKPSIRFGAGLFLRKQILSLGKISLHAELNVYYSIEILNILTTEYNTLSGWPVEIKKKNLARQFDMYVVPVLNYPLSEHLDLDLYLNLVAISYTHVNTKLENIETDFRGDTPTVVSQDKTNHIYFGVNSQASKVVTLGLGYTF